MTSCCRGIRGATVARDNSADAILGATRELLEEIVKCNELCPEDIASVIFTATPDLDAVPPARAAREIGWVHVPLLCMQEMDVTGSLPRCVRVLVHWNVDRSQEGIRHIYLHEARALRPDWVEREATE